MGAEARESKASLALMGEEIGVHIPRHIRGFISSMPGVGAALSAAFSGIAVVVLIGVIVEAIKKVVEFHENLEKLREAPEQIQAEFARLTGATKAANDEMRVTNDRLENAIAKLEHRPQNNLKLAIDEAGGRCRPPLGEDGQGPPLLCGCGHQERAGRVRQYHRRPGGH